MNYRIIIYHPVSENGPAVDQEIEAATFTIQVFPDCILLHYVIMGQDGPHEMFSSHPFTVFRDGAIFFSKKERVLW